jgi:hypothetical protein
VEDEQRLAHASASLVKRERDVAVRDPPRAGHRSSQSRRSAAVRGRLLHVDEVAGARDRRARQAGDVREARPDHRLGKRTPGVRLGADDREHGRTERRPRGSDPVRSPRPEAARGAEVDLPHPAGRRLARPVEDEVAEPGARQPGVLCPAALHEVVERLVCTSAAVDARRRASRKPASRSGIDRSSPGTPAARIRPAAARSRRR